MFILSPSECNSNADIAFVLDSSGSVRRNNFDKMKTFVKDMVDNLNVATNQSNVGLITFNDTATTWFKLGSHEDRDSIKEAIDLVKYESGTTNTAAALRMLRTSFYTRSNGDVSWLRNIAVIFTDGGSNDFKETIKEARLAREAGITLITVGVTDWVKKNELKEIASDPDENNVFYAEDFDAISQIGAGLKAILCDRKWLSVYHSDLFGHFFSITDQFQN